MPNIPPILFKLDFSRNEKKTISMYGYKRIIIQVQKIQGFAIEGNFMIDSSAIQIIFSEVKYYNEQSELYWRVYRLQVYGF